MHEMLLPPLPPIYTREEARWIYFYDKVLEKVHNKATGGF